MNTTEVKDHSSIKPFSQKAITSSAFLAGPLAATYMVYQNFKLLGKLNEAKKALAFGIFYTIGLIVLLIVLPEEVMDKIPSVAFGGLNALFMGGLVHAQLGDFLKNHKEQGNAFESVGKTILISVIGLIALLGVIVGMGVIEVATDENVAQYDEMLMTFDENESRAMRFYAMLDTADHSAPLLRELNEVSIPLWEKNLALLQDFNSTNADEEFIAQNEKIIKYVELRIQALNLIKKGLEENTDAYAVQIIALHKEIAGMYED